MALEMIIPDVHAQRGKEKNLRFYDRATDILQSQKVDRVFFMGDLVDRINQQDAKNHIPKDLEQTLDSLGQQAATLIAPLEKKYGAEQLKERIRDKTLTPDEAKVFEEYSTYAHKMQEMEANATVSALAKSSEADYALHAKSIQNLKSATNAKLYGVPGNHDTAMIRSVKDVDWLTYSQSLASDGIVGAMVCREDVGELQPAFNGPGLALAPLGQKGDDDYKSLDNSPLYQKYKGKNIDLMVAHCGGHWGEVRGKYKGGLGITQLGKEQGFVCYAGHDHGGIVYRDPESKVLTIRPGMGHIAVVERDGKTVKKIDMYKIAA